MTIVSDVLLQDDEAENLFYGPADNNEYSKVKETEEEKRKRKRVDDYVKELGFDLTAMEIGLNVDTWNKILDADEAEEERVKKRVQLYFDDPVAFFSVPPHNNNQRS